MYNTHPVPEITIPYQVSTIPIIGVLHHRTEKTSTLQMPSCLFAGVTTEGKEEVRNTAILFCRCAMISHTGSYFIIMCRYFAFVCIYMYIGFLLNALEEIDVFLHIRYASKKPLHTVVFSRREKNSGLTVLLPYFDQPFTSA